MDIGYSQPKSILEYEGLKYVFRITLVKTPTLIYMV